jgi:hypothetical protein
MWPYRYRLWWYSPIGVIVFTVLFIWEINCTGPKISNQIDAQMKQQIAAQDAQEKKDIQEQEVEHNLSEGLYPQQPPFNPNGAWYYSTSITGIGSEETQKIPNNSPQVKFEWFIDQPIGENDSFYLHVLRSDNEDAGETLAESGQQQGETTAQGAADYYLNIKTDRGWRIDIYYWR